MRTACSLDCYDACEIEVKDTKLVGVKEGHTSGFLCPHLNHYSENEIILRPSYKGEEISLEKALEKLKEMITSPQKNELLHYKGHGNFGLMQDVTGHFFASYGAVLTDGSLCDGAGEAGIIEGRGSNKNMPLSEIEKADVVVLWGRNPHVSSSHLLPLFKDKTIIVIDPIRTKIAKSADLHIQIKPHGDLALAMLIYRFLSIDGSLDKKYLEKYASAFEDYHKYTQTIEVESALEENDISLEDIDAFVELVKKKKVAFVCGVGIQKYRDGGKVMRAIDAIAVGLAFFAKEGCGVAYLGNSKEGIESPFNEKAIKVSKVNTEFSDFKTVIVQGSNPISQMPDSSRVIESISKVENLVYFGLYENETSEMADLIIPAKTFLCKNDIRTSYSHNAMILMPQIHSTNIGISEYDLSAYLCKAFDIELQSEEDYINHFKNFSVQSKDGVRYVQSREDIPYQDGFDTDKNKFLFLDGLDKSLNMTEKLFLISSKSPKSLNSQFKREKNVYLNTSHGFVDGDSVRVESSIGNVILEVKTNDDLREDCVLIYSGTPGVNNLTSSLHSYEGKSAVYQEEKVTIVKL